jgi:aminopeptidase YwaD
VLGMLPGSDPYLSREVIIVSAHYDYVGDDPDGLRYSGANDDASGIGVLLEIAHLLHEQGYQPKRSILFAAWGAQELGQIGSNYYIANPFFPLQATNAMIQLDGVGGGDGFNLGVQGSINTAGEIIFYLSAAEQALQEKLLYTSLFNESDDTPFRLEGVPSVLISWRLANEDNLPDELANAVRRERLDETGQVVTLLLLSLAR